MKTLAVLNEIKAVLTNVFGGQIERVIIFGSQKSAEIRQESDVDVLVIFSGNLDWKIKREIQDLCYSIDLKYDLLTDVKIISTEDLKGIKGQQPFIQNALSLGLAA